MPVRIGVSQARRLIEREIFRNTISKDTRPMNHNQAFGKALREQRTIQKLSQDALAYDAGLDRTFISLLELGKQSPTLDTIFTLCRALKIPFATIAQRTEEILAAAND
jgi:DNA-binding XRE family transcriptional regulator